MVDLVRDQPDAARLAGLAQRPHAGLVDHRARRVRGAGEDQPVEPSVDLVQQLGRRLEAVLQVGLQPHRLQAQRAQDVAVGGIAGRRQRDPVAGIEGGEEGHDEAGGGAVGDHHPLGVDAHAVQRPVGLGQAPAQLGQAGGVGIAQLLRIDGALGGLARGAWGAVAGLADLEVQDVAAGRRALVGGAQHVHDDEGIDLAALGELEGHRLGSPSL